MYYLFDIMILNCTQYNNIRYIIYEILNILRILYMHTIINTSLCKIIDIRNYIM